jgi:hypothetical protein
MTRVISRPNQALQANGFACHVRCDKPAEHTGSEFATSARALKAFVKSRASCCGASV